MLPLALSAGTLSDSMVIITLDWQAPWLFVRQLQQALQELRSCIEDIERQTGTAYAVEESREEGQSDRNVTSMNLRNLDWQSKIT